MKKQFKSIALAAMALLIGATANAQSFTINDIETEQGKTIEIPVMMNNTGIDITSFNFDLALPEGVAAVVDEYGDVVMELSSRSQKHALESAITDKGDVRFVSYSGQNRPYKGFEGEILTVSVKVDAAPGTYTLKIHNASMAKAETFDNINCPETTATLTVSAATAITSAEYGSADSKSYNLQGVKVGNDSKGILIRDGRKVVVK